MSNWESKGGSMNQLLTIKALSSETGLTEHQIRRAISRHGLPNIRMGRRIFIPRGSFEHWLEEKENSAIIVEPRAEVFIESKSRDSPISRTVSRIN